jgi:arylformamidase
LIDISPPLSPDLAAWPGDVPVLRTVAVPRESALGVESSDLRLSAHAGAHADAPRHVVAGAPCIDELALSPFYGPCQVVDAHAGPDRRIGPDGLSAAVILPRVLLRTGSYPDEERFTTGFAGLSPALVAALSGSGCVLVGIDTPSVDPFDDAGLVCHRALAAAGIRWLEGLRLAHVRPGVYTLVALPLRIRGGDASPVRAALVDGD